MNQQFIDKPENRGDRSSLTSINNLFDYSKSADLSKAENEITTLNKDLMNLEYTNPQAYAQFL